MVSIVLLSYDRPEFLRAALASLRAQTYARLDVTVIDNLSARSEEIARIVARSENVKLIRNARNLGYAGGMNQGIAAASGCYTLLTEDDIVLEPDCVARLVEFMDARPSAGLAAPLLLNYAARTIRCLSLRAAGCRFEFAGTGFPQIQKSLRALPAARAPAPPAGVFRTLRAARAGAFNGREGRGRRRRRARIAPGFALGDAACSLAVCGEARGIAHAPGGRSEGVSESFAGTRTEAADERSMRDALRKIAYKIAPRGILDSYLRAKMSRHARRLVALRERCDEPRMWIDELLGSHFFRLLQKRSEILSLLETLSAMRPAIICEIGAAGGGTAFVFAYAAAHDATIISVDLEFARARREAIRHFRRRGQSIICVEGDSHQAETLDAVRVCLGGRTLDVLYLDGDHSYEGVASDFSMYAPLVRPGGLVIFHDIVPDYRTRYGVRTSSETGGVPRFWNEIKTSHTLAGEIVEDEGQDGYGIGLLRIDARPEAV